MKSQIFNKDIPYELLYNFLEQLCSKSNDNEYILDITSYKKANLIDSYLLNFYNEIREYYYDSKKFYIDRKINYKSFLTVIRQICRYKNIPYKNVIVYNKSSYDMIYYIKIVNN
jgi:hypothetical protein